MDWTESWLFLALVVTAKFHMYSYLLNPAKNELAKTVTEVTKVSITIYLYSYSKYTDNIVISYMYLI